MCAVEVCGSCTVRPSFTMQVLRQRVTHHLERAGRGPFSLTAIATAAQRKKPPQVIIVVHGIDFMCSQCSLRLLEALRE